MRWLRNNFRGERTERIPHDFLNTLANFWNFFTVIGGTVQRRSDGRLTIKIDDSFPVDADGYDVAKNPDGRMTVEQNPETYHANDDSHTGERQLRNVQHVLQQSSSVPFFVSTALQGTGADKIVGELYWAQIDSKRYAGGPYTGESRYKSLDATNDFSDTTKGKWNLGLYGFVASASCSAPYSIHSGATKTLTWQVPVAIAGNPYATPNVGTITYVSNVDTYTGGGSWAKIPLRYKTATVANGTIDFGASASLPANVYAAVYLDPAEINAAGLHDSFSDTQASAKHDARFLHRSGRGTDKWSSFNQCESIASDGYGAGGIKFTDATLYDLSTRHSIGYSTRTLMNESTNTTVDWQNRELRGRWFIGTAALTPGYAQGATVLVSYDTNPFEVLGGSVYPQIRAYHTSPDLLPRTEIRGLRLYARDSATVYFDLEITDGVLTFRDHTGANCGEIRRSL